MFVMRIKTCQWTTIGNTKINQYNKLCYKQKKSNQTGNGIAN